MEKSILISATVLSFLLAAAIVWAGSIVPDPVSYIISLVSGSTNFQTITISNTAPIAIPVTLTSSISYSGSCDYEAGKDFLVEYCYGSCNKTLTTTIPASSSKNINIKHETVLATCPGEYTILTNITYEEVLFAKGTGVFRFKDRRPALRGSAILYLQDTTFTMTLGGQTRTFTVTRHRILPSGIHYYSTSSAEWGWFNLIVVRNSVIGGGLYTFFTGSLV